MSLYFSYLLALICFLSFCFFIIRSKVSINKKTISAWFFDMDVMVDGQRYRGSRSKEIYEFFFTKQGWCTYTGKKLYQTLSGRYFEIEITSDLCDIIYWKLTPLLEEDVLAFMKKVEEIKEQLSVK
jgi:hypothetical protein